MGTPAHLRYYRTQSDLLPTSTTTNPISSQENEGSLQNNQPISHGKASALQEEAPPVRPLPNTPSSGNGSRLSTSSAHLNNSISNTRSPSNYFTSRRTFASSANGSSASNVSLPPSSSTTSAASVITRLPSYIVPSASTPHLKKEKEISLHHHQRTPSTDTCKSISSISSASSISGSPASTSSPSSLEKNKNGAIIRNGTGIFYASVAASKVAPPHSFCASTVENRKKQLVHEEKHTFDFAKTASSNDCYANDTRDQVQHPITSTPVKNNKFTNITNTDASKKWDNDDALNTALQTPDWTSTTSSTFFSPSHAAFKYDSNEHTGNGDHYKHHRYQHSSIPSSASTSTSPTKTSFRPFGGDSNLTLRASQRVNSTSAIASLSSLSRQDYASITSYQSDRASRNAETTSSSSIKPATWYGNLEYDGHHNRSLTQDTNASSSTYFTNEADTSAATNSSSWFDYRSVQTGDTSFSSSGGRGGRGGGDTSFNNSKITSSTSVDHSSTSASPSKHARHASNDGSLYSFDGLADLSMTSLGGDSFENGKLPLGFDEGNASLSSIPSFNLDGGMYDDGHAASNIAKGKTSTEVSISFSEENERSDLDRLYHKLNARTDDQSRILPSSLVFASQDEASSNSYVEDPNFPKSVRDAYRGVKLNREDQPTRYLFVSGLPMPSPEEGQTMVNEIVEAMKIYGQLRGIYVRHVNYTGCLLLSFHDLRQASTCRTNIIRDSRRNPAWGYRQLNADFIEREEVVKLAEGKFSTSFLSLGEGKLTLSASLSFQYEGLKAYFSALGDVKSFGLDPDSSGQIVTGKRTYFIEYFDDRCASRAYLDISQAENAALEIGWRSPSALTTYLVEEGSTTQIDLQQNKALRPPLPRAFPTYPEDRFERYKRTAWSEISNTPSPVPSPLPEGFKSAALLPASAALASNSPSSQQQQQNGSSSLAHLGYVPNDPTKNSTAQWGLIRDDPVPDNNLIRFDRIMSGEDKRTSCILRNLPNRTTQLELMENLDEVVPREYDFIYLRFDFNSGSNCGYSFVNFTSSDALLRFWKARLGTFWDQSNSRKLCMGGMAAIQGKSALVERFRNSSVMDAKEEYRPKIFYSSGPTRGLPEPFPMSNNALRKAKSAYATGLYGLYGNNPKGGFKHVML